MSGVDETPKAGRRARKADPEFDEWADAAFRARVVEGGPQECWPWRWALKETGYGHISRRWNGKTRGEYAHRISYRLHVGPIPDGNVIDHLCRNRACVNPAHLQAVTNEVNILRGRWAPVLNAQKTNCPEGHLYDEANTYVHATGARHCRECTRINQRAAYARRKEAS